MAWTWPHVHDFGRGCNPYTPTENPNVSSRLASQWKSVEMLMRGDREHLPSTSLCGHRSVYISFEYPPQERSLCNHMELVVFIFVVFT